MFEVIFSFGSTCLREEVGLSTCVGVGNSGVGGRGSFPAQSVTPVTAKIEYLINARILWIRKTCLPKMVPKIYL